MKYVVVLYDGMADYPVPALGGKTPMMCAKKPNMDFLAKRSEVGLIKTVSDGLKPGSDVANMSVLGFDPMKYYTGRSPLEAASIGIDMKPSDVSLRTNLVTLSEDDLPYEQKTIEDYCADDISTEEAEILIRKVPAYLFPFVRVIVTDLTRESGFPPFVLAPVNFDNVEVKTNEAPANTNPAPEPVNSNK